MQEELDSILDKKQTAMTKKAMETLKIDKSMMVNQEGADTMIAE